MKKFRKIWKVALCTSLACFIVFHIQAQTAPAPKKSKTETEVIVIEETVDQYGNKTVTKTVKKGVDLSDAELDQFIKEQVGDDFEIEKIMRDGDGEITVMAQENDGESKGYLGVYLENHDRGVEVTKVLSGSAAQEAGLQSGDVIRSIAGDETPDLDALIGEIQSHKPGDAILITFLRNEEEQSTTATLTEKNDVKSESIEELKQHNKAFGWAHENNVEKPKPRLGVRIGDADGGGVLIHSVDENSAAAQLGLKEGDIVTSFNGINVADHTSLIKVIKETEAGKLIDVEYLRHGEKIKGQVKLD